MIAILERLEMCLLCKLERIPGFVNKKHTFKLSQNKENNCLSQRSFSGKKILHFFGFKEVELILQDTIINTIALQCFVFINFVVLVEIQFSKNINILWCFAGGPWRLAKGRKYWTAIFVDATPESIPLFQDFKRNENVHHPDKIIPRWKCWSLVSPLQRGLH